MPTLEIGDKRVEVGDEFLKLSPEEQQRTVNDIARQIGVGATPVERGEPVAVTSGERQFEADKKLLEKNAGLAPGALKAFTYSALNTALLNAPSHVLAAWEKISTGKDYTKAFEEQKAYEKALERQHPYASGAGTVTGIGAGLLVPGGAAAQAAKAAAAAKYGASAGRAAEIAAAGGVGAAVSGTSAALEKPVTKPGEMFSRETLNQALIGAGLGSAAQYAIPKLGQWLSRSPKLIDEATGKPTRETMETLERTFGKDRYSTDELEAFVEKLQPLVKEKGGLSPAVAREAKLAEMDVKGTRSMTTGERPLSSAEEVAQAGAAQAEQKLGAKARELIGEGPGRTDIAESVAEAARKAESKAGKKYEKGKATPGEYTAEAETKLLGDEGLFAQNIAQAMRDKGVPVNIDASMGYAKAEQAMNYLRKNLLDLEGKYPYEGGLNAKNIDAITQDLNRFWQTARADKQDQRAISAIKQGYLKTIKETIVDPAMFAGDGAEVLKNLKKATKTWKEMKDTFYSPKGAGAKQFSKMMNELVDQSTGRIEANLSQGTLDAAQSAINQALLHPQAGSAFYERLQRAYGKNSEQMNAVNQQIKKLAFDTGGDLKKMPDKIDKFMREQPTLAGKVFTTEERYQLKTLADNLRTIYGSAKPNEQKDNLALRALSHLSSLGLGIAVGSLHGPVLGTMAAAGAEGIKATGRAIAKEAAKAAESRGAPQFEKPVPDWASGRRVPLPSSEPFRSKEEETSYGPPKPLPPLTIRRATGGRVGGIAAKLMADVERAKKQIDGQTKQILNADDNHVARALEIANRGLEG